MTLLILSLPLTAGGKKEVPAVIEPAIPESAFTIVYPEGKDDLLLDPFSATDEISLIVLEGLYEGLFRFDEETGNPTLAYAESMEVSDDGLTYSFTLKNGSTFSNGDPITAQVFIDSWMHLLEESGPGSQKSSLVSMFDVVKGAREYRLTGNGKGGVALSSPSDDQLIITLDSPAPYLPSLLATIPFAAVHSGFYDGTGGKIISSGAFTLHYTSHSRTILKKNPLYHEKDEVKSEYIAVIRMSDEEAITSYETGEGHWYNFYIPVGSLRSPEDLKIDPIYSTGFYYFSASKPPYNDPLVRKALSLITPWDTLRATSGQIFPSSSLIPFSRHGGAEESGTDEEAIALIREAGYEVEDLPPLTIAIHRGSSIARSAQMIAQEYSEVLGITVIIDTVPLSLYTRYPASNPYDLSYITWVADFHDPTAFLTLFYSRSAYNIANYSNDEYDTLVEHAMFSQGELERDFYLDAAQRFLLSDSVAFPLYTGFSLSVIDSEKVEGWYANDLNIHPLRSLGIIQ